MDLLRIRAATKKKLKSRADILGLVQKANFKTKIRKQQPKLRSRFGIFTNAISFKVVPKNRKNPIDQSRGVWTVSNNNFNIKKALIGDIVDDEKKLQQENIPPKIYLKNTGMIKIVYFSKFYLI